MKTVGVFYFAAALVASCFAVGASAHMYLSHLTLDGIRYDQGVCIKPYPVNYNFPVKDPNSTDLTCNVGGMTSKAAKTCPVKAGSTITVEWHGGDDSPSDGIVDASHLGPCLVYMAPLDSNGQGSVWFKIFEDGFDPASRKWCVDKIRANKGKLDVKLPADIKNGDYLLRTEVISLQEAFADYAVTPANGAQYYPNCGQVTISGGGNAVPKGYAIPGIYKSNDPGIHFNIYVEYNSYPIPGPPVYVSGSGTANNTAAAVDNSTTITSSILEASA